MSDEMIEAFEKWWSEPSPDAHRLHDKEQLNWAWQAAWRASREQALGEAEEAIKQRCPMQHQLPALYAIEALK